MRQNPSLKKYTIVILFGYLLLGFVIFNFIVAFMSYSPSYNYSTQATRTPKANAASVNTPRPTPERIPLADLPTTVPVIRKAKATDPGFYCIHWSQVTTDFVGRKICIYGKVSNIYETRQTATRLEFSSAPNTFFLYNFGDHF